MAKKVFLVHGWSVQETATYQALHLRLAEYGFELQNVFPGRYVSLENRVEIRDIARAMHLAIEEKLEKNWSEEFHIITHSTGALVTKQWIVQHYKNECALGRGLKNVVFLAPPHFGSRLAHHGKSMLAQGAYLGDTGRKVLDALELGSGFSWIINEQWMDAKNWQEKGIRAYSLIGDRVDRDFFKAKIFPAGYEKGSDMVVRCAAANLNFQRFELIGEPFSFKPVGGITGTAFGAFSEYTHSGPSNEKDQGDPDKNHGILNSILKSSTRENHRALRLILDCLDVKTDADYAKVSGELAAITAETRQMNGHPGFAQLDFRFRDEDGQPVEDYVFKLGAIVDGEERPSDTVVHTHKNEIDPSHFTVFINLEVLEPHLVYFIDFNSESDSVLYNFKPDPLRVTAESHTITDIIKKDQTTQIDVVLSRRPERNLFVFHSGDDPDLHVKWNRKGEITATNLDIK
jgi:hypothetical protein